MITENKEKEESGSHLMTVIWKWGGLGERAGKLSLIRFNMPNPNFETSKLHPGYFKQPA